VKVVIIGMLDRQVQLVDTSAFTNLDVRYSNKEAKHSTGDEQLFAHADKLIVMTRFVSHGTTDKLPRHKLIYNDGSITRLRDILTDLNAKATPRAALPVTTPLEDEEDMAIGQQIFDFAPLLHADAGDVFEYDRPADMPADKFILRMAQARSYYKRTYGVESTQEMLGGKNKCQIKITKSVDQVRDERRRRELAAIEAGKQDENRARLAPPGEVKEVEQLPRPVVARPNADKPRIPSNEAFALWKEVLFEGSDNTEIEVRIQKANKVLAAYQEQFGV
jgi:hypothetical protein